MPILNISVAPVVGPTTSSPSSSGLINADGSINTSVIAVNPKHADAVETMNRLLYSATVLYNLAETQEEHAQRATVLGLTLPKVLSQICFMLTGNPRDERGLEVLKNETIAGKMFAACPSLHTRASGVSKAPFLKLSVPKSDSSTQVPGTLFNIGKLNKSTMGAPVGDSLSIALAIIGGEVDKTTLLTNTYKKGLPAEGKTWAPLVIDEAAGKKINTVREAHLRFAQNLPPCVPNLSTKRGVKAFQAWMTENEKFLRLELTPSFRKS
jgi:hypothetical protein